MRLTLLNILIGIPSQISWEYIFTIVSRTATFTFSCFYLYICCPTFSCFYRFWNNWSCSISRNIKRSCTEAVTQYSRYIAVVKIFDKYPWRNLIFVNFATYIGYDSAENWNPLQVFLSIYALLPLQYGRLHLPYLISVFLID